MKPSSVSSFGHVTRHSTDKLITYLLLLFTCLPPPLPWQLHQQQAVSRSRLTSKADSQQTPSTTPNTENNYIAT